MFAGTAFFALIVERLFGYPRGLSEAIGHPVMWQGKLIAVLDEHWNRPECEDRMRRLAGAAMLGVLIAVSAVLALVASWLLRLVPLGWIVEGGVASVFLAQSELGRAVRAVVEGLETSLAEGRRAVSMIVGRDPEGLDGPAVARAAVESLAENASDGVIAPLFWLILFGLPGIAVYKAINTADSMVGHRTARHAAFGWASARLDDLVNWIPARLTALLFVAGAYLLPTADPARAWRAVRRDAPRHVSPNAGWPEAALAGALGFRLGGPRAYGGETLDLAAMGDGRADLGPRDIRAALSLYGVMLWITLGLTTLIATAVH